MNKYFHNFNIQYLTLFIPFILIFIVEYLTPMQSDDFAYYIKGNSLPVHLDHYFSWSGRFVSDYFSTLILNSDSQLLKSIVIGAVLTTTLFLVTKIGNSFTISDKRFYIQFLALFFIYWITSPNVGQIVFWIVGAGNYLVTNFFVVLYFYALMQYINKKKRIALLLFSSFLVGCSNENTTWIVLLISLITSGYFFVREKNKILFSSTLLVLIGFSVLIFSPGNFHRAALLYTEFYELSLLEKIWLFLSEKLPYALGKTWMPILISLILLTTFINKKRYKSFYLSSLFVTLGLLSTLSMVVSPSFPTRALSGPHLFYIISCSFSISHTLTTKNIKSLTTLAIIILLAFISFIFSYIQILFSYNSVNFQEKIRAYEVQKELTTYEKTKVIPAFYYPKTLRAGDSIDLYHDAGATGKYYKLSHPVDVYPIKYNYAVLINGKKIALPDSERTGLSNIFIGRNSLFQGTSVAIQFNNINSINTGDKITVKTKKNKTYEFNELNINSLYGMDVIGFTVPAMPNEIDSISYQSSQGNNVSINLQ